MTQSAGKQVQVIPDWFWFYLFLDVRLTRDRLSQPLSLAMENHLKRLY